MQLGMVGLGKMGANMTERLVRGGHQVVGYDRNPEAIARVVMGRALRNQQRGVPQVPVPEPPERVRAWLEGLHVEDSDLGDYDQLIAGQDDDEGGDHGEEA